MKKRLVTSALPYVNNIPHLGNLIQVLSADVFSRFCRMAGYETLYVCGTDEYGTATETKAREEGISPRELCDRYHIIHRDIYEWFGIAFDHFSRTSCDEQTKIVQDIYSKVRKNGFIKEHEIEQLYSEKSNMFLADRYVIGICPHCSYDSARGDQCENCGKLLDPTELIEPRSSMDGTKPIIKKTKHLYIDLPKLKDTLESWMTTASVDGFWAKNALQMTKAWIKDGLKERAITRDLKWGIPVNEPGYEGKVFYVWFDAPIGYISMTAEHIPDWEKWWKSPDDTELFQFIGKDNIPFHTVIFPCTLLATDEKWTMLHHMSSTEYLNYEMGKFSKSKGIGVFGSDAKDTGIEPEVWRFYLFYNRPETSDYTFTWKDFQDKVNKELLGNLGNLVNRTLAFYVKNFGNTLPNISEKNEFTKNFWNHIRSAEKEIYASYDKADLRDGFQKTFELSAYGNKVFQESEPWKKLESDRAFTEELLANLIYLVRDLAILIRPVMPQLTTKILSFFELGDDFSDWSKLGKPGPINGTTIHEPKILIKKIENIEIDSLRDRYSGSQKDREEREQNQKKPEQAKLSGNAAKDFSDYVDLRTGIVKDVKRHPDAEKLYVLKIDDGMRERVIVSGLVAHHSEAELFGKTVALVANLKPAKLRGVLSEGMLLAGSFGEGEAEKVEAILLDGVKAGLRIGLEGQDLTKELPQIDAKLFFGISMTVKNYEAEITGKKLLIQNSPIKFRTVSEGILG